MSSWVAVAIQTVVSVPFLIGLLVIYHTVREQKPPADTSNRINKIRLVWFAITREDLFVNSQPWLKNDEYKNVRDIK
jgi:hypothetical protein